MRSQIANIRFYYFLEDNWSLGSGVQKQSCGNDRWLMGGSSWNKESLVSRNKNEKETVEEKNIIIPFQCNGKYGITF